MREDLASALAAIFEGVERFKETVPGQEVEMRSIQDLIVSALDQYKTAQERMKAGDWAGYGEALDKMEKILEELARTGR
jgi:hypothetical protein